MRRKILLEITYIIFFLSVLHIVFGEYLSFYIKIWWWDLMTHFIGGAFIGIGILWAIFYSGYLRFYNYNKETTILFTVILATLFIAIGWEIFEYSLGLFRYREGYALDTTMDIIMGIIGGVAGVSYFIKRKYHLKK